MHKPAHYTHGDIEPISVIESWALGFHLGNVVKYVARAGHKSSATEIEDLEKARWYLDRHIEVLRLEHALKSSIKSTFTCIEGVVAEVLR